MFDKNEFKVFLLSSAFCLLNLVAVTSSSLTSCDGRPVRQRVSTDSLKFHPGPLCPTFLRPVGGPPPKRTYAGRAALAVFYPLGYPIPYGPPQRHVMPRETHNVTPWIFQGFLLFLPSSSFESIRVRRRKAGQRRMGSGGHGFPKFSHGLAMPDLLCHVGRPPLKQLFQGWPPRSARGLWTSSTPLDTPRHTPMKAGHQP
jgi:hypothetical protein